MSSPLEHLAADMLLKVPQDYHSRAIALHSYNECLYVVKPTEENTRKFRPEIGISVAVFPLNVLMWLRDQPERRSWDEGIPEDLPMSANVPTGAPRPVAIKVERPLGSLDSHTLVLWIQLLTADDRAIEGAEVSFQFERDQELFKETVAEDVKVVGEGLAQKLKAQALNGAPLYLAQGDDTAAGDQKGSGWRALGSYLGLGSSQDGSASTRARADVDTRYIVSIDKEGKKTVVALADKRTSDAVDRIATFVSTSKLNPSVWIYDGKADTHSKSKNKVLSTGTGYDITFSALPRDLPYEESDIPGTMWSLDERLDAFAQVTVVSVSGLPLSNVEDNISVASNSSSEAPDLVTV